MKSVPLKYVASINAGQSPSSSDVDDLTNGLPFLQGNAEFGRQYPEPRFQCNAAPKRASAGDILLSVRAPVGELNISNQTVGIGRGLNAITARSCHPGFLWWWMHSQRKYLDAVSVGSTYRAVTAEDVAALRFPVVELEEQRRIADFLDAETSRIDRLLALRIRQRDLAEERILGVIRYLAIGGRAATEPSGNTWIPEIPANWQVLSLKRRWRIIDCKHRTPNYVPSGYPVVSPGDISEGRLDLSRCHRFVDLEDYEDLADDLRRARRGDIVYSRNASVGTASYVDTEAPFTMGQDVCRITSDEQDQLYLTYVLNVVVKPQLNSLQVGSTFTRVNIGTLLDLAVPCPPPQVQRSIAREMDSVTNNGDLLKSALDRQMALLAERRQALITAAVTGQFDVTTASGRNTTQGV
ncbi:restriction endonuclease subunit S [Nocardia cyriacigeorgica]|uniref:Type I restriction modification DNA specificity domain-containing protein n=1 Tax=Nocardia cyriacigeorgica TaxID=135487 RepID=A0A5R8NXC7_9NOCA|nr:restriction endonuclease subunit S [Nocardia cyriacigeorgica]TLF80954.1 hypothetical protein FEK34_04575 [Nocardia cyriacigeorgica]